MEKITISGHEVIFPFKPYPLQKAFMNQVLSCLKDRKNGLLESPTGTGKTLSLLCSSLAWLEKQNCRSAVEIYEMMGEDDDLKKPSSSKSEFEDDDLVMVHKKPSSEEGKKDKKKNKNSAWTKEGPRILYSSRTHAQLSQACKEMKRTAYNFMKGLVIGGRENLCINNEVLALDSVSAKNHGCRARVSAKQCQYHSNYEKRVMTTPDFANTPIMDMEDLVEMGTKHNICPYYASRILMQRADVIFAPYNYILDPTTRTAVGIDVENNVIIIDEGHNIEKVCEDSVSCELKSETLESLELELKALSNTISRCDANASLSEEAFEAIQAIKPEDIKLLQNIAKNLATEISEGIQGPENKRMHPQEWVFDVLKKVKLTLSTKKQMITAIDDIQSFILVQSLNNSGALSFSGHLTRFVDFLTILFPEGYDDQTSWEEFKQEFMKKYRVFTEIEEEEEKTPTNKRFKGFNVVKKKSLPIDKKKWTLNLWCLSASVSLKTMHKLGAHCIIITSGTLAPLNSFQVELELPFPITLQNLHVISPSQIGVYVIRSAWNGITFNSSYSNRENMDHVRTLGQSIAHFCRLIPNGVLLFFSSYAVMNNLIKVWKEKDREWRIYSSIMSQKQIFLEPQGKGAFNECIEKFKEKVDAPKSKGALFMGVCRGKLSEGLDMANQYCRAVMMVGLPFPAVADPRVIIKKQYLQEMNNKELSPTNWYTLQMKRALNQAIGRVVRNKDDYGVVLLLDARFQEHVSGLSRWIQKYVQVLPYADASKSVEQFFQSQKEVKKKIGYDGEEKEESLHCVKSTNILTVKKERDIVVSE